MGNIVGTWARRLDHFFLEGNSGRWSLGLVVSDDRLVVVVSDERLLTERTHMFLVLLNVVATLLAYPIARLGETAISGDFGVGDPLFKVDH